MAQMTEIKIEKEDGTIEQFEVSQDTISLVLRSAQLVASNARSAKDMVEQIEQLTSDERLRTMILHHALQMVQGRAALMGLLCDIFGME